MQNSKDKQRIFAFIFQCSIEYRSLLLSGLYEELIKHHKVILISRECSSKNLDEYSAYYKINTYKFDKKYFLHPMLKIENLVLASRKARHRIKKIGNFGYFSNDRALKWTDYILGNNFVFRILNALAVKKIHKHYVRKDIQSIYQTLNITDVILCGYSNAGNKLFAINAIESNVNVWITLNNWKDLYVNNFIPFIPNKIFSWNNAIIKEYLKRNMHLTQKNFSTVGNPAFDRFYKYKPKFSRSYYENKYGIQSKQPLILYTLLAPDVYSSELEIVKLIGNVIKRNYPDKNDRPFLLLRRNPMDEETLNEEKIDDDIVFAEHYFEGSKEKAIFIQSIEGESEWLDLIYYSDIVVNVASTVTLEALMMKKPVINIEFNGNGDNEPLLKKFTEAPFYTPLLNRSDVKVCRNIREFESAFCIFIAKKHIQVPLPDLLGNFDGNASKRLLEKIFEDKL